MSSSIIGSIYYLTHASSVNLGFEAESGNITAARVIANSSASAGEAMQFVNLQPTPDPSATPIKYMPLGDSITDGFIMPGSYRTVLWQKLVQQDHDNIDFVGSMSNGPTTLGDKDHEGHSGWCIDGTCGSSGANLVYPMITTWQATYKPDIISIHLGTNDLDWTGNGTTVAARLDALVNRIYQNNPHCYVVLVKIIYMNTNPAAHDDYVNAIPAISAKYQAEGRRISVADLATLLTYPTDYRDQLHPTQAGYDKMGAALYPALSAAYHSFR